MSATVELSLLIAALIVSIALMALHKVLPAWSRFVLSLPAAAYVLYLSTTVEHPLWVFGLIGLGVLVVYMHARDLRRAYWK